MSQLQPARAPEARRSFAPRYAHRGAGITLVVFGAFFMIGALSTLAGRSDTGNGIGSLVVAIAMITFAVYLLRGVGVNPRVAERRAAEANRRYVEAENAVGQAIHQLAHAPGRGAALVAFRDLEAAVQRWYPQDVRGRMNHALTSIDFDMSRLHSPLYGTVPALKGGAVEIFQDWVICGGEVHDVEPSTRGRVYVDGALQVSSAVNQHGRVINQTHDLRTAELQFTSSTWSMRVPIPPDLANEARRLVDQQALHLESLRPQGVTAADIKAMVDTILSSTGQPPAEKLTQLSNLRFNRLLTDEEFEQAKAKILGIR